MNKRKCEGRKWNGWEYYPCSTNAKVQRDGKWYCGRHDPVAKAAKEKARRELIEKQIELTKQQHQAKEDAMQRQEAKAAMFAELVEALRNLAKISDDLREEHDEPLCDALERADALLAKAKEIQNVSNPTP